MTANDFHRMELIVEHHRGQEPRCLNASRGCDGHVAFHGLYCPKCSGQQQTRVGLRAKQQETKSA